MILAYVGFLLVSSAAWGSPTGTSSDIFCANNCSLHGTCVSGACHCDAGWQSSDCALACGSLGQTCCGGACTQGACLVQDGKADGTCSSYAGMFVWDSKVKQCVTDNFYTRDCSCPANYKVDCVSIDSSDPTTYPESMLCFCHDGVGGADFGGFYVLNQTCHVPNPMTAACSCVASTMAFGPVELWVGRSNAVYHLYTCGIPGLDGASYPFGGLYERDLDKQSTCQTDNPVSGDCRCSDSVTNQQLVSCPWLIGTQAAKGLSADIGACATAWSSGGVLLSFSASGLETVLLDALISAINHTGVINMPDFSGHDYKIEGMQFTKLWFDAVNVAFNSTDSSVTASFRGGNLIGTIRKVEVHESILKGDCRADPFNLLSMSMDFDLETFVATRSGHPLPQFAAGPTAGSVGDVEVTIHGGDLCSQAKGKIEDSIHSAVKGDFGKDLAAQFGKVVANTLPGYAQNLSRLVPVIFQLNEDAKLPLSVDLSMTGCGVGVQPTPSAPAVSLPLRGSVFARSGPTPLVEAPLQPTTLSGVPAIDPTKDVQLCLSTFVFDSAFWTLFESDLGSVVVTESDLPPNSPVTLNTSSVVWKAIAPDFPATYPDDAIQLQLSVAGSAPGATSPQTLVESDGLTVTFNASVLFQVVSSTDTQPDNCVASGSAYLCDAFRLVADVTVSTSLAVVEQTSTVRLEPNVTAIAVQWALQSSNVGDVSVFVVQQLDALILPAALKSIDAKLANSTFTLPTSKGWVKTCDFSQPIYVPTSNPAAGFVCLESQVAVDRFRYV